uniref:Uncharacterized protein n=1 Tax=Palpitomonas bilix TaxID=652834 RepID=A0A7S3GF82_9EUKA
MLINSVFILITASISLGIEFYHYATGAEEVSTIFYVFHLIVTVSFFLVMSVCTSFMFFHIYTIVVNRTTREHIKGLPGGTPSMEHVKDLFLAPLGPVDPEWKPLWKYYDTIMSKDQRDGIIGTVLSAEGGSYLMIVVVWIVVGAVIGRFFAVI